SPGSRPRPKMAKAATPHRSRPTIQRRDGDMDRLSGGPRGVSTCLAGLTAEKPGFSACQSWQLAQREPLSIGSVSPTPVKTRRFSAIYRVRNSVQAVNKPAKQVRELFFVPPG